MQRKLSLLVALMVLAPQAAYAVPSLQLFIEAGDPGSDDYTVWDGAGEEDPETWARIGTDPFRIWTVAKLADDSFSSSTATSTVYDKDGKWLVSKTVTSTTTTTTNSYRWSDIRFVASFDQGLTPSLNWEGVMGTTISGFTLTTPQAVDNTPGRFGGASTADPNDIDPWAGLFADNWPDHGMYGAGRDWAEWQLGPIEDANTRIGDFQPDSTIAPFFDGDAMYPDPTNSWGQIRAYTLTPSGLLPGQQVHFDLWGTYDSVSMVCTSGTRHEYSYTVEYVQVGTYPNGSPKYGYRSVEHDLGSVAFDDGCSIVNSLDNRFAPWSHDARWEQAENMYVPAPGALALFSLGLFGIGALRRRTAGRAIAV